jgi:hypothetical protein
MKKHSIFNQQNALNAKRNQRNFSLIRLILLIVLSYGGNVIGQTTVFTDNFNVLQTPITSPWTWTSSTSSPQMTWTAGSLAASQGQIQTKGTSPNYSVQMASINPGSVVGREYLTGSLSTFSSPFNSTLKNNSGDVTWTFNMGTSRAMSTFATAFDAGAFWGSAVILAMSGSNPTDAATNGYAVVMTQGSANNAFKLVKFAGGLIASANVSTIIGTSTDLAANTSWASIKVIYTPGTDTWKLYVRDDAVTASGNTAPDPTSGTALTQVGSVTDNNYTSAAMSSYGFFVNHSAIRADQNWTRYDNFKVTVTEAITWTSGWPKAENATLNGLTAKVNTSVAGTAYYVVLANGATAPTSAQVKAGLDATGASLAANLKGSIACAAGATEYTTTLTGLSAATTYDLYFVAEDGASNLQGAPTKVSATTTSIVTSGYPKIENETLTGFTAKSNLTVAGKTYYVVLANGATAPTSAQVKSGQDATGSSVAKSGLITCTLASTEYSASVTGLSSNTDYDVYFVSEDASSNNLQAAPVKVTVSSNAVSVFVDDFNRASVSPGGSPSITWSAGTVATLPANEGSATMGSNSYLKISTNLTVAGTVSPSRTYLSGPLSTYAIPFSNTLSSNTGAVTWTFNAQARRPSSPPRGFDDSQTGYAVILAMTSSNPMNTSTNGYAVTIKSLYPNSGKNTVRLVKFTNGLVANANIDSLMIPSAELAANDNWASVKVVYTPSTNSWALYVRDDNSITTPTDPTSGTFIKVGVAVDNTYTSSSMTSCGFFWNEGSGKANTACYGASDNFKVTVDAPITFTSGWPKVENATSSGFTAKTNANIGGTSYYVVLPSAATAPSSAQVKAGQDATGASLASNLKGSIACAAGATEYTAAITALTATTTYDVYFVAENLAGNNLQTSPTKVTANTLTPTPTISSFTPTSAGNGTTVTITGTNLLNASSVSFGGTAATSFSVVDATSITAVVAAGATGNVSVTTAGGTATKTGFIWLQPVTIITGAQTNADYTFTEESVVNVPNGATLSINGNTTVNRITIEGGGKITNNSTLAVSSSMTINSDGNGTGTYVDKGTSTITATVNQQLSSSRNWYMSSPVSGATAPGGPTYWKYVEALNNGSTWTSVNSGEVFNSMTGYIVKPSSSYQMTFAGTLYTGDQSITGLTSTATALTGFNLVANPYPSYVNWSMATKTNLSNTIWYRTHNGSAYKFYTFNSTSGAGGIGVPATVTNLIPPMQAFWVKVDAGTTGTLAFTNAMRSHQDGAGSIFRAPSAKNTDQQILRLQVSNEVNTDETVVYFNANAQDGFDAYDSPKMSNGNKSVPEIYTTIGNDHLVINGLNSIAANKELALGFNTGTSNTFTIKALEMSNFDADAKIILKDNLLNSEWDLTGGSSYSFTSDVTNTISRFTLVFKTASNTSGLNNGSFDQDVKVYKDANNHIIIHYTGDYTSEKSVVICNAIGQKLIAKQLTAANTEIDNPLDSGVYFVTVNIAGNNITKKVILN